MAKKTRTELSTSAINTNLPDNTQELITPTTERAQLTDERESVVNYKDDLGGAPNAGKFLTVATDGESLTMVDAPTGDVTGSGVQYQVAVWDGTNSLTGNAAFQFLTGAQNSIKLIRGTGSGNILFYAADGTTLHGYIENQVSGNGLTIGQQDGLTSAVIDLDDSTITFKTNNNSHLTISSGGAATFSSDSLELVGTTPMINIKAGASVNGRGITFDYNGAFDAGSLINYGATGETRLSGGASGTSGYFLGFHTDGTEKMRISSGGVVSIPNGIVFNNNTTGGTPNATGVTLNDYEEGTWTPTVLNANTSQLSAEGTYTRIGNIVRVGGLIIFNTQTNTTQLTIQSFPFQVGSTNEGTRGGVSVGYSTSSTYYTILMDDGSTQARVWAQGATGNPTVGTESGTRVYFGGTYQI